MQLETNFTCIISKLFQLIMTNIMKFIWYSYFISTTWLTIAFALWNTFDLNFSQISFQSWPGDSLSLWTLLRHLMWSPTRGYFISWTGMGNKVMYIRNWLLIVWYIMHSSANSHNVECFTTSYRSLIYVYDREYSAFGNRVEGGLDDPVNLGYLGHFLMGQVDLIRKLNYLDVTQISYVL